MEKFFFFLLLMEAFWCRPRANWRLLSYPLTLATSAVAARCALRAARCCPRAHGSTRLLPADIARRRQRQAPMVIAHMEYNEDIYWIRLVSGGVNPEDLEVTIQDGRVCVSGNAYASLNNGEQGVKASVDWSTKLSKLADASQPFELKPERAPKPLQGEHTGGSLTITFKRKK